MFAAALAILIAIDVLAVKQMRRLESAVERVEHTHEVINALEQFQQHALEAQVAHHGFTITGRHEHRERFLKAAEQARVHFRRVRTLTRDNPAQQERLRTLEPVLEARLALLQQSLQDSIHAGADLEAQLRYPVEPPTMQDHADIAGIASAVRTEEERLREQHLAAQRHETFLVQWLVIGGSGASMLLLLCVVLLLRREICRRRVLESSLRESREDLRLLIDQIGGYSIVFLDPAGHIVSWNQGAARLAGFQESEVVGQHFSRFFVQEDRDLGKPELVLAAARAHGRHHEIARRLRRDGSSYWADVNVAAVRNGDGSIRGFSSVVRDITSERESEAAARLREEQLRRLSELADFLQSCYTSEEAHAVIASAMPGFFPDCSGALFVLTASHNLLDAVVRWGDRQPGEMVFAPDQCWALRRNRPHENLSLDPAQRCSHLPASAGVASVCIPLAAQGDSIGMLMLLGNAIPEPQASGRDPAARRRLAITVSEHIALALGNLRLRETLRHQSLRDPLTGLFNRRYLEESLEREVHRAARSGKPLAALMVDVDHFKRFNDAFGHEAGDLMLREIGNLLQTGVRGEDVACRYGGEEFALVLPDAAADEARRRAEQQLERARRLSVRLHGELLAAITLSIGVAAFPEHRRTPADLLRAADHALYRAKHSGRDRVAVAERAALTTEA
ncbi:MAG TPA: diguanylate cyclase [Terriglobales bacterium]|nr:diguanylate cyclase [Terriglobales bacterium]